MRGVGICAETFAEMKTEQFGARTLEILELYPVPPAPCGLVFFSMSLEKVLKGEIKNWAAGGDVVGRKGFFTEHHEEFRWDTITQFARTALLSGSLTGW